MSLITVFIIAHIRCHAQLMSQNLPKRSLEDNLSLHHPKHFVLAGTNNKNVIITYRFLATPVQANQDFFYIDCMTVYFNCRYFPSYTRELLECLLRISHSGRNPCRGNDMQLVIVTLYYIPCPLKAFSYQLGTAE